MNQLANQLSGKYRTWQSPDGTVLLVLGDCLDLLPQMEAGSVDAVVTDPPYSIAFTGESFAALADDPVAKSWASKGLAMTQRPRSTPSLYKRVNPRCGECGRAVNGKSTAKGFKVCECGGKSLAPWPNTAMVRLHEWHIAWAIEVFRLLPNGRLIVAFAASRTLGRMTCAIEDAGFEIRDTCMWRHNAGVGRNAYTLRPVYEPFVVAAKPYRHGEEPHTVQPTRPFGLSNCFDESKPNLSERAGNEHPTLKPVSLMRRLVELAAREDEAILDPFMGSGTTGVACVKTGRKFIGIEREPKYFDIACKRIETAQREAGLFAEVVHA